MYCTVSWLEDVRTAETALRGRTVFVTVAPADVTGKTELELVEVVPVVEPVVDEPVMQVFVAVEVDLVDEVVLVVDVPAALVEPAF